MSHAATPNRRKLLEIFSAPVAGARDNDSLSDELVDTVRRLAASYLGGQWKTDREAVQVQRVHGGLTNYLFRVSVPGEKEDALLRIYSSSDSERILTETVVFTVLSERQLGPRLLSVFPGGRFEQFIPSRNLTHDEYIDIKFIRQIAAIQARFHSIHIPIKKRVDYTSRVRDYLSEWSLSASDGQNPLQVDSLVEVDKQLYPSTISAAELAKEYDFIDRFMRATGSAVVFSHNDNHAGNILLRDGHSVGDSGVVDAAGQPARDGMMFIDFEFCSYNYRLFDIAQNVNEFAFSYDDTPPFVKCDPSLLWEGGRGRREAYVEAYLEETYKIHSSSALPVDICGDLSVDAPRMLDELEMFMACVHLCWPAWILLLIHRGVMPSELRISATTQIALYFHKKPRMEAYLKKRGL